MHLMFSQALSDLRREKGISQRLAAQELGVSQALLSHYENGIREPGLAFVVRACDYYQVSADYLLGRTAQRAAALGSTPTAQSEPATLLKAADALSEVCADLCRRDPDLAPMFRRVAAQLSRDLSK